MLTAHSGIASKELVYWADPAIAATWPTYPAHLISPGDYHAGLTPVWPLLGRLRQLKGCWAAGQPQGWMQEWAWGHSLQRLAWLGAPLAACTEALLLARLPGWIEGWLQASVWVPETPEKDRLQPPGFLHGMCPVQASHAEQIELGWTG